MLDQAQRDRAPAAIRVLDRTLRPVENGLALVAGTGVGLLAILLVTDMIRRRFFNETFIWLYGFTGLYVFAAAVFLSLPYAHRINAHIVLDVVTDHLSTRWNRAFHFVGELVGIALFLLLFYAGFEITTEAYSQHQVGDVSLPWPLWTHKVLLPIGAGIAMLRSVVKLVAGHALDDAPPQRDDALDPATSF